MRFTIALTLCRLCDRCGVTPRSSRGCFVLAWRTSTHSRALDDHLVDVGVRGTVEVAVVEEMPVVAVAVPSLLHMTEVLTRLQAVLSRR